MLRIVSLFAAVVLAFATEDEAAGGTGLSVSVYDGPTECEEAEKVEAGKAVQVHYTGTIDESSPTGEKGKKFDSSRDRGDPFTFNVGRHQVIAGWDEGFQGLCKGAKAVLVIPSDMAYGPSGAGQDIPGGATLRFDVEVVDVMAAQEEEEEGDLFTELDTDKSGKLTEAEILAFFVSKGSNELPDGLMEHEDKDKDGEISWEEFSGPKGSSPPEHVEL